MGNSIDDAQRLLEPLKEELLLLVQELVRAESVNSPPDGNEAAAQAVLAAFFRSKNLAVDLYGIETILEAKHPYVRSGRDYRNRKNLAVRVAGSGRGRSLLLNGHIDTVPPARNWSTGSLSGGPGPTGPWSGCLKNGRLYGLGSFDMKGGLAAQAAVVAALQRGGVRLGGDLLFESMVDEEWGGGGGTLAARLRGDSADACVISEGTQLEILRATRGGYVVDLELSAGDPAQYFTHEEVISPALALGRVLHWIEGWSERRKKISTLGAYVQFSDPAPVQILAIEANTLSPDVPLSVPTRAAVRVYFQFLPDENVTAVIDEIRNSLLRFEQDDAFFREHPIVWRPLYEPALLGHELAADHPWTRCFTASARRMLGKEPVLSAAPYPCDAFLIHREFGIPTLLFGPRGAGAHNPDEYVETDSVLKTAEVLLSAALRWCNHNG